MEKSITVDDALLMAANLSSRVAADESLTEAEEALVTLSEFILSARAASELVHRNDTSMVLIPYWFMRSQ